MSIITVENYGRKKLKKIFFLLVLTILFIPLAGCSSINLDELKNFDYASLFDFDKVEPADIHVYAPMSLRSVLEELIPTFESENEGFTVSIDYGTPSAIMKDLEDTSTTDLVITTSQKQLVDLQSKDLIGVATKKTLATNALVLFSRATSELTSLDELSTYSVQKIVIGDPSTVPCGQYAKEALTNMGLYDSLQDKISEVKSVTEIFETVEDTRDSCGIVYKSDVVQNPDFKVIASFPDGSYTPVPYTIVMTKTAPNPEQAEIFENFLLSEQAKSAFTNHGFDPSTETVQE